MADLTDGAENDVRSAIAQLQGTAPAPEPMQSPEPTWQPEPHTDPQTELDRVAAEVSRAMDGGMTDEPEHPARQRDPAGRFARKEAPADPETQRLADRVEEAIRRGEPKRDADRVPTRLNKAERAVLEQLEPELRGQIFEMIARQEEDTARGVAKLRERFGEGAVEIDRLLAPRREQLRQLGFDRHDKIVSHLLSHNDAFEKNPVGAALHIFQHMHPQVQAQIRQALGVQGQAPQLTEAQLDDWAGQRRAARDVAEFQSNPSYAAVQDPQVRGLMQQVLLQGQAYDLPSAFEAAVLGLAQHYMQNGGQLPAHLQEPVGLVLARREVEAFHNNPEYEFFPQLQGSMKQLLESGRAQDLKQAYLLAMNGHTRLRSLSPQALHVQKQIKASNASLTGAPHGSPRPQSKAKNSTHFESYTEDVRDAIEQLR